MTSVGAAPTGSGDRYCDCCLLNFTSTRDFVAHLSGACHECWKHCKEKQLRQLFATSEATLNQLGSWERCFSCGPIRTDTVVTVECSRCDNAGGRVPSKESLPGTPLPGSSPRFICLTHALVGYCMSCSTYLGFEAFVVDQDAAESLQ